jgi:hypothetical protein
VRIVEIAGIGPGPFAATLLSDMGSDVVRIERVEVVERARVQWLHVRLLTAVVQSRSTPQNGRESRPCCVWWSRPRSSGVPAGRHRAARPGPEGVPGSQPAAGVRAHDRLGADGPFRAASRPRHQLHLIAGVGALQSRRRAATTLEHDGRLRRVGCSRLRGGVRCSAPSARAGAGHPGRPRRPHLMETMWGMRGMGLFSEGAVPTSLTPVRRSPVYETADDHWVSIGSIEPRSMRSCSDSPACATTTCRRRTAGWPRCAAAHRGVRAEGAGGVDRRAARGDRRLLRAGAADERGEQPSASGGLAVDRRARRHGAAVPHALRAPRPRSGSAPLPSSTPMQCCVVRLHRRRDH